MKLDDTFLELLAERYGPVSRTLSYLIRPTFIADPGKTYVWGDWSAIEARGLPWLAGSRTASAKLDVFRENDADPDKPDIYITTACELTGGDPHDWWARYQDKDPEAKQLRQAQGKVPELSLGYGGGMGALTNMAANYGVYFDEDQARRLIDGWRQNNPWARRFWDELWQAACAAIENPGTIYAAGRVAYVYDAGYLGGTLICALPDGRPLMYPAVRWSKALREMPDGTVIEQDQLTYMRGYGRAGLWYGKLAENVTQGICASILRRSLKLLDHTDMVVGHTHDEIIGEVDEALAGEARDELRSVMLSIDDWMEGLPLAVETTTCWYYSKAMD